MIVQANEGQGVGLGDAAEHVLRAVEIVRGIEHPAFEHDARRIVGALELVAEALLEAG